MAHTYFYFLFILFYFIYFLFHFLFHFIFSLISINFFIRIFISAVVVFTAFAQFIKYVVVSNSFIFATLFLLLSTTYHHVRGTSKGRLGFVFPFSTLSLSSTLGRFTECLNNLPVCLNDSSIDKGAYGQMPSQPHCSPVRLTNSQKSD